MWLVLRESIRHVIDARSHGCPVTGAPFELFVIGYLLLDTHVIFTPITRVLRLVFTSDGVVVGVVIRSVERYDLVKIKPTESEAEHWFCLWLRHLWSCENYIVGVASRSKRISQWQCSVPGLLHDLNRYVKFIPFSARERAEFNKSCNRTNWFLEKAEFSHQDCRLIAGGICRANNRPYHGFRRHLDG